MLLAQLDDESLQLRFDLLHERVEVRTAGNYQHRLNEIRCNERLEVVSPHGHYELSDNYSSEDRRDKQSLADEYPR